jgi:hypothetical protein
MKKRLSIATFVLMIAVALGVLLIKKHARVSEATVKAHEEAPVIVANGNRPPQKHASASSTPLLAMPRLFHEAQWQEQYQTPSTLVKLVESVLNSDRELAEFYKLREKALRTKAEKQRYKEILADPIRIQAAKEELLEATETDEDMSQEDEIRRLLQLRYLKSALDWADNPRHGDALDSIKDVLFAELPATMPESRRGSVLGDKIDLYQHLLIGHPKQAQMLKQEAMGTKHEAIFALAEKILNSPVEAANDG